MSGGDSGNDNYQHIKALVRDIHVTRNVARPNPFDSQPQTLCVTPNETLGVTHRQLHDADHIRSTMEKRSLTLMTNTNTNSSTCHRSASTNDTDRISNGDTVDAHTIDKNKSHSDECILNVPSVIITDATEPLDLFHSTQRRFSQLYSGLRRLSTSHTVRTYTIVIQ